MVPDDAVPQDIPEWKGMPNSLHGYREIGETMDEEVFPKYFEVYEAHYSSLVNAARILQGLQDRVEDQIDGTRKLESWF